jgi:putative ribosome biogenesis GTPase RsgA
MQCRLEPGFAGPLLFGGKPDTFDNPYNVCGTVSSRECKMFDPSKSKYKWTKWTNWSTSSKPNECMRCSNTRHTRDRSSGETEATIERTITNISDDIWSIKFEPDVDVVGRNVIQTAVAIVKDDAPYAEARPYNIEPFTTMTLPSGGNATFRVPSYSSESRLFPRKSSGALIFIDRNREEYRHTYKGRSNITDLTFVCPIIRAIETKEAKDGRTPKEPGVRLENEAIVVVGRFGSGKSTLLNTLAGVHWNFTDGQFVRKEAAGSKVEKFATSRSVKGCTMAAVATDISTFDGRELTVIDTVGFDDTVSAESLYNKSNLTEVMNRYNGIAAVVIVMNSKDPRITQGFLESLLCVPKSFKKKIQKNVMLVFTNWSAEDEDEFGNEPHRGYTEQVKIIRAALGFEVEDDVTIPAFWVDNRLFKKYTENAAHTIRNLTGFLDHVYTTPKLSCHEYKEMRALSQFERIVRKALKQYFQPSNRNKEDPSGFEKFLFECADQRADEI